MNSQGWIRDLTEEGIHPHPGPGFTLEIGFRGLRFPERFAHLRGLQSRGVSSEANTSRSNELAVRVGSARTAWLIATWEIEVAVWWTPGTAPVEVAEATDAVPKG